MVNTPWNYVCVKGQATNGEISYAKIELAAQGMHIYLSQWWEDASKNKVVVQARSNLNVNTNAGGTWQYNDSSGSGSSCSPLPGTLTASDLKTARTASPHLQYSTPSDSRYICVKGTTAWGETDTAGMKLLEKAPVISANAEIRGIIRANECEIVFNYLKAKTVFNNGGTPGARDETAVELVIGGSSLTTGGIYTWDPSEPGTTITIIDMEGTTASQVSDAINNWTFGISRYRRGGNLHNFQDWNRATSSYVNYSASSSILGSGIDKDLRGLKRDCNIPTPEPCPAPSNADYTITNPGIRTRSNVTNNNFPYQYDDYPPPNYNPVISTGRGDFEAEFPEFELNQVDLPSLLQVTAIGGHTEDTNTGLTIDASSAALLEIDFYPNFIQSGSPSVSINPHDDPSTLDPLDPNSPYPYPYPLLWGGSTGSPSYRLVLSATVYELDNTYNRVRTVGTTSVTFNRAESKQLSVSDPSPNTSTIRTYEWAFSWTLSVSQSYEYTIGAPRIEVDPIDPTIRWVEYDFNDVSLGSINGSWNGSWTGRNTNKPVADRVPTPCSRTLTVQPPTCQIYSMPRPGFNYGTEIETETFNPTILGATTGRIAHDEMFPVGRDIARTQVKVTNHNPFSLSSDSSHHPTFDVTALNPYNSGSNPYNDESGSKNYPIHIRYYEAGRNDHIEYYHEPDNAINYPGKYETSWTVNWKTKTQPSNYQNWGTTAADWNGGEHEDNRCMPGAQLSQDTYVYAVPPSCSVNNFLFEVGETLHTRVTLSNPNQAAMRVDRADWQVIRKGTVHASGSHGTDTIPKDDELEIDAAFGPFNFTGKFTVL